MLYYFYLYYMFFYPDGEDISETQEEYSIRVLLALEHV